MGQGTRCLRTAKLSAESCRQALWQTKQKVQMWCAQASICGHAGYSACKNKIVAVSDGCMLVQCSPGTWLVVLAAAFGSAGCVIVCHLGSIPSCFNTRWVSRCNRTTTVSGIHCWTELDQVLLLLHCSPTAVWKSWHHFLHPAQRREAFGAWLNGRQSLLSLGNNRTDPLFQKIAYSAEKSDFVANALHNCTFLSS